jgi:RHS repeat-associated protein
VREPVSGANTLRRIHAYGDGLNLTGITETAVAGRNESYTYTPTNRLQNATGIWGSLTWSYDGVGNRTQEVLNDGSTVTTSGYGYPAGSNRLSDVTQGAATVRSFTHDAAGNITHDDRAGTVYRYIYNDRGRLQQLRIDSEIRANYRYDFFERLNWRQTQNMTPSGATHYIQDLQGQLIVEASDTGTPLREYIWIDDIPLAVFADLETASPQLYFVHPDHLNRPLRMTDGTQALVWDAVYRPFGEVHSITGSATLNLRFPGQYFLIESGLAYNWHRHYDATLGRYTQPDPLGLVDGPSLYTYAKSAPTQNIDPGGRAAAAVVVVPIALCARFPILCAAIIKTAGDACIATYRAFARTGDGDDDCAQRNEEVQRAKARTSSFHPARCESWMTRWQLQQRYDAWLAEAIARARRDQKCWAGGDTGHQQAQAQAWQAAGRCAELLR